MDTIQSDSAPAEKTAVKQRGRPFESANPEGRPKGSRNKTTLAVEALLDGVSEAITLKLVEKALEGDSTALRLCLDRLLPPRRDRRIEFDLPPIETAADALSASSAVLAACANGVLSPGEAAEIMGLVATHVRMLEMNEIEARLSALEEAWQP